MILPRTVSVLMANFWGQFMFRPVELSTSSNVLRKRKKYSPPLLLLTQDWSLALRSRLQFFAYFVSNASQGFCNFQIHFSSYFCHHSIGECQYVYDAVYLDTLSIPSPPPISDVLVSAKRIFLYYTNDSILTFIKEKPVSQLWINRFCHRDEIYPKWGYEVFKWATLIIPHTVCWNEPAGLRLCFRGHCIRSKILPPRRNVKSVCPF